MFGVLQPETRNRFQATSKLNWLGACLSIELMRRAGDRLWREPVASCDHARDHVIRHIVRFSSLFSGRIIKEILLVGSPQYWWTCPRVLRISIGTSTYAFDGFQCPAGLGDPVIPIHYAAFSLTIRKWFPGITSPRGFNFVMTSIEDTSIIRGVITSRSRPARHILVWQAV